MSDSRTTPIGLAGPESTLRSSSDFAGLAPEIQDQMYRRLGGLGLIYAGAWIANFTYLKLSPHAMGDSERFAFWATMTALGAGAGVGLYWLCRTRRIPANRFMSFAGIFQVAAGLGIVLGMFGFEHLGHAFVTSIGGALGILPQNILPELIEPLDQAGLRLLYMNGVTWTGIWLLAFPLIIPAPLMRTIVTTLSTALTVPSVMLASIWLNGVPETVQPWVGEYIIEATMPTFICGAIAVYSSRVVYRLTRDLSKARQMGSYQLVERIGVGGMGEVWKAKHRLLARPAAIKLIRPERLGSDPVSSQAVVRRFEREAQATSGLTSPHTIQLFDFGVANDGTFYYVMELLDGIDLKSLVDREGPMPAERVVHILRQLCHSLEDAHQSGIVHRDIKPANVFLCRYGADLDFVKVLDFGLVKEEGRATGETQLTVEGIACGTPGYMAPEMISGGEKVGHPADIYAVGCVGYWLLTGEQVFDGNSAMEIIIQHAKDDPVPPSHRTELPVPEALEEIILSCLAKAPADRPDSARELRRRLEDGARSIPPWSEEQAERWWQLHLPKATSPAEGETLPYVGIGEPGGVR